MIWATGFDLDHGWIDAPVFDERGAVVQDRGVTSVPGLSFLGLPWSARAARRCSAGSARTRSISRAWSRPGRRHERTGPRRRRRPGRVRRPVVGPAQQPGLRGQHRRAGRRLAPRPAAGRHVRHDSEEPDCPLHPGSPGNALKAYLHRPPRPAGHQDGQLRLPRLARPGRLARPARASDGSSSAGSPPTTAARRRHGWAATSATTCCFALDATHTFDRPDRTAPRDRRRARPGDGDEPARRVRDGRRHGDRACRRRLATAKRRRTSTAAGGEGGCAAQRHRAERRRVEIDVVSLCRTNGSNRAK